MDVGRVRSDLGLRSHVTRLLGAIGSTALLEVHHVLVLRPLPGPSLHQLEVVRVRESSAPVCLVELVHLVLLQLLETSLLLSHRPVMLLSHELLELSAAVFIHCASLSVVGCLVFLFRLFQLEGWEVVARHILLVIDSD